MNRIVRTALSLAILTCPIVFSTMAEAQASSATIKFDEPAPQPLIVKATNGSPVVSALLKSIKELKSYRFHAVMRAVKDGKFKDSNATIYFKDPNLMCVEVGGHGPKAGSKLIRNAKGTIRFKGGPALFGITMTMQPDSRLLRLPSGQLVTECDYLSLFQGLAKEMSAGLKVTASPSPISLDHEPGQAIILETQEAGQNASFVRERILIDPKTSVPILWVRFKDGRLIASVKFEDLRLNLDVGNDMFNF